MRMITGFMPPSDGKVSVGGFDVTTHPTAAKRLIGYLPENAPVYVDMTVRGFLGFCAELSGLGGAAKKAAIQRAVEMCFLESVLDQSVDTLSKGFRHRTCFAQAIIHDPEVLVLDEPTDGLDPNQKHEIRNLIRRMGETKAIIFSTHILEEVEAVCSRAIIIDRGSIVANGTPKELKQRSELGGTVVLEVSGVEKEKLLQRLGAIPNARKTEVIQVRNETLVARVYPVDASIAARNGALMKNVISAVNGWRLEDIRTEEGRLDEVFRSITLPDTAPKNPAAGTHPASQVET
jgi:ABC-2 type transport system ATP-binding protein